MKVMVLVVLSAVFVMLSPQQQLFAHKVNIYAYLSDGIVHSESYFADGSRCKNCTVEVFEKKTGKSLLEGKTDENGKFSFKAPPVDSLKLVLKAGAGHQGVYYLLIDKKLLVDKPQKTMGAQDKYDDKTLAVVKEKCLSPAEVKMVVDEAVEAKLQPFISRLAMIEESANKAGTREIIGGIGYIIGIAGIILYFISRKNYSNKK